jgi:hypothetical protein
MVQRQLHVMHVQPAAELVADFAQQAGVLEPECRVERDATTLLRVDRGDDDVMTGGAGRLIRSARTCLPMPRQ